MCALHIHYKSKSSVAGYHHKQSWWQIARPLTLTGTISPIIVGTIVVSQFGPVHFVKFIVLIISAVLIQAGVNILNDYFDFANGQDTEKWHIPDEEREVHTGPQHDKLPLIALSMFVIAMILGLWLVIYSQPVIMLIGMIGIYVGYKYSAGGKHSFSALGLGELTAAIFLGIIPVMLAFIVQGESFGWIAFATGSIFALLISMMILTNNIRDIHKDQGFRQTIAIRIGKKQAVKLLTILSISVYVVVTLLVFSQILPWSALIVYFALPFVYRLLKAFNKYATQSEEMKGMKIVAQHHWIFSMLLIVGMLIDLLWLSN